jgi:hypothetical protein
MAHPTHLAMAADRDVDWLAFPYLTTRYDGSHGGSHWRLLAATHLGIGPFPMSATDDAKADRLTLRLPSRDLERLRELARQRRIDVAALGREAISAYLDGVDPRAEQERLGQELKTVIREQADRVIERHEQTTRALIAALNEHLGGKP